MIDIIFELNSEYIQVRIIEDNCGFRTGSFGGAMVPIDSLKIDKSGSIKEHPDLKNDPKWKEKTIKRFKEKLKQLNSEDARAKYIMDDLKKFGYKPRFMQRAGHRKMKIT